MKIKIFKKIFEININMMDSFSVNHRIKEDADNYRKRALFLMLIFLFFSGLSYYRIAKNSEYQIGAKLTSDLIAYKKVTYKKDILDKDLEKLIISGTNPQYDKNLELQDEMVNKFTKYIEKLNKKAGNEKEYYDIERYLYLIKALTKIYDNGIVENYDLNKLISDNELELTKDEVNILKNFIYPNLKINSKKTKDKITENLDLLRNNERTINKGDIIAKKGDVISPEIYDKIEKLGLEKASMNTSLIFSFIFSLVISVIIVALGEKILKKGVNSKGFYPTLITFTFINLLNQLTFNKSETLLFFIPYATVSIIAAILTKDKIFSIMISMITNLMLAPNIEWFIAMNLISMYAINNNHKLTNRLELIKNGFKIGAVQAIFSIVWGVIYSYDTTFLAIIFIFSLLSGFLTGMICLGIIPYFENTFRILTEIKLLEIGDYSFPLLKRLLLEAPGTFYHSIMVGALAEQAAECIDANPTLARVGAYYHDIGKLKRPLYFVENQGGLENLHNNLNPSVSALILTSHPKDGFILAKQYGLPDEVLKIIVEHHGTTSVQYFYYKAVEIGEKVGERDFRYGGPKPSSKEAAIVMLADTVEAAVRASSDKSHEGIESTIRYLIKYKMDDNQLTNSDLTFKDIEKIIEAFLKVLKAAYHERIKYPKINGK